MKKPSGSGKPPLRSTAEARLAAISRLNENPCSPAELLYELQLHQIELEMQNENLSKAYEALEESHQNYMDLYDFAPVGYLTLSRKGLVEKINLTGAKLLGESQSQLLRRRFAGFVSPTDSDCWHLFFDQALKQQQPQSVELALKTVNGRLLHVQMDCVPALNGSQKQTLRVAITDVTKSKKTRQALWESEGRHQALVKAIPGIIFKNRRNGEVMSFQAPYSNFLFMDEKTVLNRSVAEIFPLPLAGILMQAYAKALDLNIMQELFYALPIVGQERQLEFRIVPCTEDTLITLVRDITERLQAEDNLRIAAVAFESQQCVMVTDEHAVILRVNQAFTDTTGYSMEEVIGKSPRILQSGVQDMYFYAFMWKTIHSTGMWKGELWNKRKNGEHYLEHITITAVTNQSGIVTHYVSTFSDVTLSRAAAEEIEKLAYYDSLTGLPNRRLAQDRLKRALAASKRNSRNGALLFFDLDNFKKLNDSLGHAFGDLLLQQVGERLTGCVRECDTVARLGGDEFVLILEDLSCELHDAAVQTEAIGEKILAALNQPYQLATHVYHSTPSIGAVVFKGDGQTMEELLKQADIAMYQAKSAGRNTLRFFDAEMQTRITARITLEADLRVAVAEKQFELYYQLQTSHQSEFIGAEVLIRWQHPQRGLVSPVDFIPVAEETGLILPIGQWVLDTACAQIKTWENNSITELLQLAVNVSARQFHQADFVEKVCQTISRHRIKPARLKLELTESLVLDNIAEAIGKMNELRNIGVRFSMDDFGTGYSSLSYLTQLPLDQLKIDQSFVRNIGVKPADAVIVQTIIGMANNLGMEVIAEGVETEAQRAFLEKHDCGFCQGFLFSKPVPIEAFEALMTQM